MWPGSFSASTRRYAADHTTPPRILRAQREVLSVGIAQPAAEVVGKTGRSTAFRCWQRQGARRQWLPDRYAIASRRAGRSAQKNIGCPRGPNRRGGRRRAADRRLPETSGKAGHIGKDLGRGGYVAA